jgi:DNA-binding MarR family transcriptional regulator
MTKSDYEALAHFRYQLRRFLRFSEDVTRRQGITPLQYLLLLQIRGFPGREWASVGELAERLQAKQHGVVSLISRCEAAGLVRRSVGRSDRRRVEVTLTRKGEERLERLARTHRAELRSLQSTVSVPEFTGFLSGKRATRAPRKRVARVGKRPVPSSSKRSEARDGL